MASSSSSFFASCQYDVFLSFRGEDTRDNFTSHLDYALRRKKLNFFIDEVLERGDEISLRILNAIKASKISVIVFSKNYASSKWCLDELINILECQKLKGQIVIPVFYHVDPHEVRKQTGSFGNAFIELAKRFKKMPKKVQKWKDVLTKASNISGWDTMKVRPEAKLVDEVVKDILKKLERISVSTHIEDLVGLDSRIEQIKSLLCLGLPDFRIVGIWGMGGIGKTTIAGAIFNQICHEFEHKSFIANVKEESQRSGLIHLREQLLFEILDEKLTIKTFNLPGYIKERLQRMKVFLVLDDVNKLEQLDFLAGRLDQFGPGSRIIVTTRDKQILEKCGVDYIYEVEKLNYHEASKLFISYAFRKAPPSQEFIVLSDKLIDYTKGNPLALKVLGSFFDRKTIQDWKNALHNLHLISGSEIYDLMKISYDELNMEEQSIFLDIACFFNGDDKDHVIEILNDPFIHYRLNVLIDKSLVIVSQNCKLQMHDLLQEMGREIVRRESIKEPGKRSRLWYHEDVCRVLKQNKGTDVIEGIFLNLSKIRDIHLDSKVFANMPNLRLLKFYMTGHNYIPADINSKVHLPQGLECLSEELKYLHWHGYPLKILPMNFNPNNLIELSLPYSKVQQLWEEKKEASKLKFIDLEHSYYLKRIPDPLETPNLERINLLNCINLPQIPSSIQNFNNLGLLCFTGCTNLSCFPSNIHFRSPITVDFSFCINLAEFPQISGNIIELDLQNTAIEEVPSSIENLTRLERLDLWSCKRLTSISTSICKLKSLCRLDLAFCSKLESLPEILEQMESLEYISLVSTKIKNLPSSIELLKGLTELRLNNCSELDSLPENLGNLKSLKFFYGDESAIRRLPSSITYLSKLVKVDLYRCRGLILPPLSGLSNVTNLRLSDCDIMKIPQDIGCLSSLKMLDLRGNKFENLPTSFKQLSDLKHLLLDNCNMLQTLPELPLQLEVVSAYSCNVLESLPELPECQEKVDVSLLKMLSQSSHVLSSDKICYIFSDCSKLNEKSNNILADSQLRIQHMAIASLKLFHFYERKFLKPPVIKICLPGSGIPKWFSNQCLGSSITIQLPQYCCNRNFIGFALCAVFGCEENSCAIGKVFSVKWSYRFEKKTLSPMEHWSKFIFIDSDHIFLGFDPCCNVMFPNGDHQTAVSIDFSIESCYVIDIIRPKVKCCGVNAVYAHPNKTQLNTFSVNMMPPTAEECTQIMKLQIFCNKASTSRTSKEELEPCPKRICREQINTP